jgi:hypothetical protein
MDDAEKRRISPPFFTPNDGFMADLPPPVIPEALMLEASYMAQQPSYTTGSGADIGTGTTTSSGTRMRRRSSVGSSASLQQRTSLLSASGLSSFNSGTSDARGQSNSISVVNRQMKARFKRLKHAIELDNQSIMSSLGLMKMFSVGMCVALLLMGVSIYLVRDSYMQSSLDL